jgi:hypothetical protein
MRHANSETLSFVTTTVGHAAALSVVDTAQSTRFGKFAASEEPDQSIEEAPINANTQRTRSADEQSLGLQYKRASKAQIPIGGAF